MISSNAVNEPELIIPVSIMVEGTPALIPDDNYELVLKFKFDLITEGFMRKLINYYNGERDRYKKLMNKYEKDYKVSNKEEDRIKAMMYNSFQGEAKIINNTFYGVQGNKYYDHADLPAAIFVTAIGRWTMTEMVRMFGKKAIIEMDSVTGDTPVYVRDKNTLALDIITISDLHIDSSIKRIKYSGNYQIMTRHGWADIEYTKAHKVTKDIHRIKISDGSVKLTCDHSLFDINEKEVSPKDIIKNNRIELLSSDIKETMFNVNNYHGLRPINKDIAWFYGLF
ncbi:hypothetical protein EOM86_11270, partial [Candidatus Nomurabacteria bacterium]|nr:hypothetical protein [Candidatus Nomurabacteria bacterium]